MNIDPEVCFPRLRLDFFIPKRSMSVNTECLRHTELKEAIKRVREYVLPLESERVKKAYGMPGSVVGKMFILEKEMFPQRTYLVLVKEKLGY